MRLYRYDLGFAVNGVAIPDPAGFSGATADLDSSAERAIGDGLLHRNWVAQKINLDMQYTAIDWEMCNKILQALNSPQFQFTFPDPNTGALRTGDYYVGDRKWNPVWMPGDKGARGWYTNLTFSVIEY